MKNNEIINRCESVRPLPVSFLEWVHDNGYIRFDRTAGPDHALKWFRLSDPKNHTSNELFELFKQDVNEPSE